MIAWRVTRGDIVHAFFTKAPLSLCGLARRADTIISYRGDFATVDCDACVDLSGTIDGPTRPVHQDQPQDVV